MHPYVLVQQYFQNLVNRGLVFHRGAATDSGPPGQHIHSGPPAFRGWGGGGIYYRNRDCVPKPVFFSPSPKSDYTVSAIKIVQFCM